MTEPCSCFYFEFDADATDDPAVPVCACGHVEDEHTKAGECEGEVSCLADGEAGVEESFEITERLHTQFATYLVQTAEAFAYLGEQLAELGRQIQAAQAASEDHPL